MSLVKWFNDACYWYFKNDFFFAQAIFAHSYHVVDQLLGHSFHKVLSIDLICDFLLFALGSLKIAFPGVVFLLF